MLVLSLCLCSQQAHAQANEIVQADQVAGTLSGRAGLYSVMVDGQLDFSGIPEIKISLCDPTFKHCALNTKTDDKGYFTIRPSGAKKKRYYLQFLTLGFDELDLVVTLKRGAGPIRAKMALGT